MNPFGPNFWTQTEKLFDVEGGGHLGETLCFLSKHKNNFVKNLKPPCECFAEYLSNNFIS